MVKESGIHIAGPKDAVRNDIVDRAQCRDLASFQELVRKYQPYAFSLALRLLADEPEATDVVQESFIRVWKHIDQYDPNQRFTTWLYKIVTNLCFDRLRALKRRRLIFFSRDLDQTLDDLPDERDWQTIRSNQELVEIITTLVAKLSPKQRIVFTMRDLQDLTVEEVVQTTGLSAGSVKTNLHYARRAIRDLLVRHYGVVRGDL